MAADLEILFLRHTLKKRLCAIKTYENKLRDIVHMPDASREEKLRKALELEKLHVTILKRLIAVHGVKQQKCKKKLADIKKHVESLTF